MYVLMYVCSNLVVSLQNEDIHENYYMHAYYVCMYVLVYACTNLLVSLQNEIH